MPKDSPLTSPESGLCYFSLHTTGFCLYTFAHREMFQMNSEMKDSENTHYFLVTQ